MPLGERREAVMALGAGLISLVRSGEYVAMEIPVPGIIHSIQLVLAEELLPQANRCVQLFVGYQDTDMRFVQLVRNVFESANLQQRSYQIDFDDSTSTLRVDHDPTFVALTWTSSFFDLLKRGEAYMHVRYTSANAKDHHGTYLVSR